MEKGKIVKRTYNLKIKIFNIFRHLPICGCEVVSIFLNISFFIYQINISNFKTKSNKYYLYHSDYHLFDRMIKIYHSYISVVFSNFIVDKSLFVAYSLSLITLNRVEITKPYVTNFSIYIQIIIY